MLQAGGADGIGTEEVAAAQAKANWLGFMDRVKRMQVGNVNDDKLREGSGLRSIHI